MRCPKEYYGLGLLVHCPQGRIQACFGVMKCLHKGSLTGLGA